MTNQPSIGITMVNVRVPIEVPRKRGRKPVDREILMEISRDGCRIWDAESDLCAEGYSFGHLPPRISYGVDDLLNIPNFEVVYRYLVEQYAANRNNPLGKFLAESVAALDAEYEKRHGTSVYFARSGDRIKIGWSAKVSARLAKLQTGNPDPVRLLATTPGGRKLERQLHDRFADARISGEWFEATPELVAYIEQLANRPRTA